MASPTNMAKRVLKDLQDAIARESFILNSLTEKNDRARSEAGAIEKQIQSLQGQRDEMERLVEIKKNEHSMLSLARSDADGALATIHGAHAGVVGINDLLVREVEARKSEIANLEVSKISLGAQIDWEEHAYSRLSEARKQLASEISIFSGSLARLKSQIAHLENRRESVHQAIEEAIRSFRLFERRIHRFSNETGYTVGYKDPALL